MRNIATAGAASLFYKAIRFLSQYRVLHFRKLPGDAIQLERERARGKLLRLGSEEECEVAELGDEIWSEKKVSVIGKSRNLGIRAMDQERGNCANFGSEIRDFRRLQEEIESLMAEEKSSFTALLGLPPNQAMQLLHDPGAGDSTRWNLLEENPKAEEDSPQTSSSMAAKAEAISDSNFNSSSPLAKSPERTAKRKEQDKCKAKKSVKKSKTGEKIDDADEKLPYVHVRARRGQATDSHSLAERARREKINARMKLLQELVPGCSKISGTALVLDEIINHVQSLQRQVEFLSMRLAAINPRMEFNGLESFLADGNGGGESVSPWCEAPRQQQAWPAELAQPLQWRRSDGDQHDLSVPGRSLLRYGSVNSASLRPNQLKQEL